MDPKLHRESIMLLVNEPADRLRPLMPDNNLSVEVEKKLDFIDRRLCVALGINFDITPSAYSYD